ncbi:hypothetical protein ADK52_14160 [Streptomyces sp. WM6372]|nr:hypothetical protein ADK52_14160 [Streptomyces sp. WM6372]
MRFQGKQCQVGSKHPERYTGEFKRGSGGRWTAIWFAPDSKGGFTRKVQGCGRLQTPADSRAVGRTGVART